MSRFPLVWLLLSGVLLAVCPAALARTGAVSPALPEADAPPGRPGDIDRTLVNTFTTEPITAGRGHFCLPHRFARDLGRGRVSSLVDDVFGLDNGAVVTLELRRVAAEKLTRGHVLQLNVGNTFATTPDMLARGGAASEAYSGFNLSRKF